MARNKKRERVGDVLGLGDVAGSTVLNHDNSLPHESDQAQRRRRMSEGADELTPSPSAPTRTSGATSIDMGSGGEGTDLE